MNKFTDLIEIANNACNFEDLTTAITESDALNEGRQILSLDDIYFKVGQNQAIARDYASLILPLMSNHKNGCLNKSGINFIKNSGIDLFLLFQYFPRVEEYPKNFSEIISEPISPLLYFQFANSLFDSIASIQVDMVEEQRFFSNVIQKVVISTKSLLLEENISSLNISIVKIAKTLPNPSLPILKPILQSCFLESFPHQKLKSDIFESLQKDIFTKTQVEASFIHELQKNSNLFTLNTDNIYRLNSLNEYWCYPNEQKMLGSAKQRLTLISELIGEKMFGSYSTGNVLLSFNVRFHKKFRGTRLEKSSFISLQYKNIKHIIPINEASTELCIPINFEIQDVPLLNVSLIYVLKKYNQKPFDQIPNEGFGCLLTTTVNLTQQEESKTIEFTRRESSFSLKCGKFTVNVKYYDNSQHISLKSNLPKKPKIYRYFHYLVNNLVNEWVNSGTTMSIYPPIIQYCELLEFSIKYSFPTPTVFLLIASKLLSAWCHSESYLKAFTTIFLTAYVSMKRCVITSKETEIFQSIVNFLKESVPKFLLHHLSKPGLYEYHGLFPLYLLFSFVIPEKSHIPNLTKLLRTSEENIIQSVTGTLTPIQSTELKPEAEALLKYLSYKQRESIHFNSEPSLNGIIDLTQPQHITFDIKTISNVCENLNKRSNQIKKYYEDSSLPLFFNQQKAVFAIFQELSINLCKMFNVINDKLIDEQSMFKFIFNYQQLYTLLEINDTYSPYKLFYEVVLEWISKIGEKMIEWTTNIIKLDNFEIQNQSTKTSSSLYDLITMFNQSLQFLISMQWKDQQVKEFVETFLSLCKSCLNNYTEILTLKMLSYFPIKLIEEFNTSNNLIISTFIKKLNKENINYLSTPKMIYIIINNFINLRTKWSNFLDYIKSNFKVIEINECFNNPVPYINVVSKSIPYFFAGYTSNEITNIVLPHLYVKNKKIKIVLNNKPSKYVLNPLFLKRDSELFQNVYNEIIDNIKMKIDDLNGSICNSYYNKMIKGFLNGIDSGLMNLLLFTENDPIKYKRLIPIYQFIDDILNDIFEYLTNNFEGVDENDEFDEKKFAELTPYCNFFIANIKKDPFELINEEENEGGKFFQSLSRFIIISSYTHDAKLKNWAHVNRIRFNGCKYLPPM